jgi:hypothetical protein
MQATIKFEDITYIFSIKSAEYNFCNEDGRRFLMFRFYCEEKPTTIPEARAQYNYPTGFEVLFPADSIGEDDLITGKVFFRDSFYDAVLQEHYAMFYMATDSEITNIRVEILEKCGSDLYCRVTAENICFDGTGPLEALVTFSINEAMSRDADGFVTPCQKEATDEGDEEAER